MNLREVFNNSRYVLKDEVLERLANEYPILLSLQKLYFDNLEYKKVNGFLHYGEAQLIAIKDNVESGTLNFDFLQKEMQELEYPIHETGHLLCYFETAEKFYDENEEIAKYFEELCEEIGSGGYELIKMSVTEVLESPEVAKQNIINGYTQSLAVSIMEYEVNENDIKTK